MTALNCSTRRRLKQLPQIPSVWEGDRRPLAVSGETNGEAKGECILWVDGSQGVVRAIDMVGTDAGPEAIVRALLRAMEYPHGPAQPARPQKIVVCNREVQFFLRGVLQDLEIAIDYVPSLPLIDELFREFEASANTQPPQLPPQYAEPLTQKAYEIWHAAPWKYLAEHQIVAIELNQWDVGTLYASVMGMLGMEYGILLYRSLDSLKRFRASVLQDDESLEQLEEAFLGQDCLFVTFEGVDDFVEEDDEDDIDLSDLPISEIQPTFGNIHPLEGLRSSLDAEEALIVLVALEAFNRFLRSASRKLAKDFPSLSNRYRIPYSVESGDTQQISIKVTTLPEVATELYEMTESVEEDEAFFDAELPALQDDLVPQNAFLSIGMVSWEMLEHLRTGAQYYQTGEVKAAGDGLPVILIQTSRPKAKTLIEKIHSSGGLKGIGFNPGEDPFEGDRYDLGIIQTNDGEMHLFGEFSYSDPTHQEFRKKWEQRCKKTKGYCGLLIARGSTGAAKGNPQLQDMVALFEARSLSSKDLGLGTLQRTFQLNFE